MSDVATWTAVQVFGDVNAHHGSCCDCCIGYCPGSDDLTRPTEHAPGTHRLIRHYVRTTVPVPGVAVAS